MCFWGRRRWRWGKGRVSAEREGFPGLVWAAMVRVFGKEGGDDGGKGGLLAKGDGSGDDGGRGGFQAACAGRGWGKRKGKRRFSGEGERFRWRRWQGEEF
ncbi:UNVERIFIED_CONTAM: hypothetical protein Sindi_1723000 [Sesamum indicum]